MEWRETKGLENVGPTKSWKREGARDMDNWLNGVLKDLLSIVRNLDKSAKISSIHRIVCDLVAN